MPAFEYQQIGTEEKQGSSCSGGDKNASPTKKTLFLSTFFLFFFFFSFFFFSRGNSHGQQHLMEEELSSRPVMHISDTHIDFFFDPSQSMMKGVCHQCNLSSSVWGSRVFCPTEKAQLLPEKESEAFNRESGYAFGRYGCNPPHLLWRSLHQQMQQIDPDPPVIVFTGDISPHGFPDDKYDLTEETDLSDLCETKFMVTRHMVRDLVSSFPGTKWAFAMGNNDHLPKNLYWQLYAEKFGKMLLEEKFFTKQQYEQFVKHGGASYIDSGNTRYLSLDLTLYMEGGEASFEQSKDGEKTYPIRSSSNQFVEEALKDAKEKGLNVYIVGHQPFTTKKGKDEYEPDAWHFKHLKSLFAEYASVIRVGLFGHRNVAGFGEVLNKDFMPLFPSLTAPGVSPRGRNQPSFNVLHQSLFDSTVLDFEQWKFDLQTENNNAKKLNDSTYLGTWSRHKNDLKSWRALSGEKNFTVASVSRYLRAIAEDQTEFFDIEEWKRAGYIGDETPEIYYCKALYDVEDMMMRCLFPNQDAKCWDKGWLM